MVVFWLQTKTSPAMLATMKRNTLALQEFTCSFTAFPPFILLTISFPAVKNTWLHRTTVRTAKKKGYSCHGFSSKTAFPHPIPLCQATPGERDASQTLALLMLRSCSQEAAQQMKGAGAAIFAREPEKNRIEHAREDVWEIDWQWGRIEHCFDTLNCQHYLTKLFKRFTFVENPPNPNHRTRLVDI